MTYFELLQSYEEKHRYVNELRVLMMELMESHGLNYYLDKGKKVSDDFLSRFKDAADRLEKNEPLAYILGYRWFYNYSFFVNENVLIPRFETEELLVNILNDIEEHFDSNNINVLDIATGSGVLGISIAKEFDIEVDASDISPLALEVARRNASHIGANVNFYKSDMAEFFLKNKKKYDIIVCNPPYIKEIEDVSKQVLDYEPHIALFGGEDGLYFYRKLFEESKQITGEKFMIACEIGYDLKDSLKSLAEFYFPSASICFKQDLQGLDRMIFIYQGINQVD